MHSSYRAFLLQLEGPSASGRILQDAMKIQRTANSDPVQSNSKKISIFKKEMAKLFCNRVFGFLSSVFLSFFDTLREGDMKNKKDRKERKKL